MQSFDIVIHGGGLVGLALACGLQGTGLRVAVIEKHAPEAILSTVQSSLQVSAINAASRRLLHHLQVWEFITEMHANPYLGVEVWERDSFGRIFFDGIGLGYPELGYIIENTVMQQALWRRAEQLSEVTLIAPDTLRQVTWGKNEVLITLNDNRMLITRLVVAADGARSSLRTHADIPIIFWGYQHHALVATVHTAMPHGNIARQVFHGDGILAFLPLSDPHLSSVVWSLPPPMAQELLMVSAEVFNANLAMYFSLALGVCELHGERQTFPLTGLYARNFASHRLVLVGDAAHTVHPLAGQGVNLGFMDVAELLGEVRRLRKSGKDIGHYPYLQFYERRRKYSAALTLAGMQGFCELFAGQQPLKKWVRAAGLQLVDSLPGLKLCFIKQAMGLNDLPSWLVSEPLD
ncbi:FAD-dependent 2-octaprenylphenol hydroxylase [Sodalis endosymbiont of Henestaris halophilus]|uniref:FAD-dependent 2-octaprenylphenol hydroxylase n=1 Tax=Sodalis endosymbiont of Henestaris halophilus TaxID=1929246 RepID=UPI000BC0CD24|nr:FAD-dependent 2-octaprenylphenol hydroxylase [Sodalis endosymbiont of Henestaris halophilus]SNC58634.1 2-octaprenylphenol hydroxylase [Sodalis endosymbiont of Henestaris halophilus]